MLSAIHAFQFAYNLNSAVTFFILYNTLDVPLSANSVLTLTVNSRGWSFLRVVFSQTRNFTVIAFTGWIYCIEIFFTLPWKTEFAVKFSTVLNIFLTIQDFWVTCACPETQSLPWKFSLYLTNFTFWIFEQHALALKNKVCPKFTVLNIYFLSFRILEQLALALKNRVALKFFTILKYFLSFRIFEQLALALKIEFALNPLYWISIFYHSGFLSNLRLLWKTRVALIFFTVLKYFYHSGFLKNLRLPWKQSLPWNFSIQGAADPPPRTPMRVHTCFICALKLKWK